MYRAYGASGGTIKSGCVTLVAAGAGAVSGAGGG